MALEEVVSPSSGRWRGRMDGMAMNPWAMGSLVRGLVYGGTSCPFSALPHVYGRGNGCHGPSSSGLLARLLLRRRRDRWRLRERRPAPSRLSVWVSFSFSRRRRRSRSFDSFSLFVLFGVLLLSGARLFSSPLSSLPLWRAQVLHHHRD